MSGLLRHLRRAMAAIGWDAASGEPRADTFHGTTERTDTGGVSAEDPAAVHVMQYEDSAGDFVCTRCGVSLEFVYLSGKDCKWDPTKNAKNASTYQRRKK